MATRKQLSCLDYHVAWICPVADVELLPARLMLDEEHLIPSYNTHFDENTYICGSISGHTVVVATCPQGQIGNVSAGRLTGSLFKTFPNIRMALLVGIGSGVPNPMVSDDPLDNIHLGDVIVGKPSDNGKPACVYYDRSSVGVDGKFEIVGTTQNPDWRLMSALSILVSDYELGRTTFETQLARLQSHRRKNKFAHPGFENDNLFKAHSQHNGTFGTSCIACSHNELIHRPPRTEPEIVFHQGRIATTNAAIHDGEIRDQISMRCDGILCIETEAAGVDANRRCLVVRGVSDYADSHGGDKWRSYAAGNAAAFTRELLCKVQPGVLKDMEEEAIRATKEVSAGVVQALSQSESDESSEVPWLVPFARPQFFVGRESQLAQIKADIFSEEHQRLAIYGLGGCGKTALALELIYQTRIHDPTRAIFWVPAITAESFEQAYQDIGAVLHIPGVTANPKADVKQLVKDKLSNERFGKWLMVIDNADDAKTLFEEAGPSRLIDYLPHSPKGSIVFTTRTRVTAVKLAANDLIALGELSNLEAREVLRTRLLEEHQCQLKSHECRIQHHQCRQQEEEIVDGFLEMLTCLALAIVQAIAFINTNDITISDYVEHYRHSEGDALNLLCEEFEDKGRYREIRNPVATTWYMSFEQIQKQNDLAVEYLSYMACIENNDIPASALPQTDSAVAYAKAIGVLKAYAFLTERHGQVGQLAQKPLKIFDVHPLVHVAMRGWLKANAQWSAWIVKALNRLIEIIPRGDYVTRELWTPYLPHAMHLIDLPEANQFGENLIALMNRVAHCEVTLGRFHALEPMYKRILARNVEILGMKHPTTLGSMYKAAQALMYCGKYSEATKKHQEILELREQVLGEYHRDTLASMDALGTSLAREGKIAEASRIQTKTLEARERIMGKSHSTTLTTMNQLARTLSHQGKHAESEKMHRETLALYEQELGHEHPKTLRTMHNIAKELYIQGHYAEAERLLRQVVRLGERILGKEHPDTLTSLEYLAKEINRQGNHAEAERMFRRVLELDIKTLGKHHPNTIITMSYLATTLSYQNQYLEAEQIYKNVMNLNKQILGDRHPATLTSIWNVASVLGEQKKYKEALPLYEETYLIHETAFGADHSRTREALKDLDRTRRMIEEERQSLGDSERPLESRVVGIRE